MRSERKGPKTLTENVGSLEKGPKTEQGKMLFRTENAVFDRKMLFLGGKSCFELIWTRKSSVLDDPIYASFSGYMNIMVFRVFLIDYLMIFDDILMDY